MTLVVIASGPCRLLVRRMRYRERAGTVLLCALGMANSKSFIPISRFDLLCASVPFVVDFVLVDFVPPCLRYAMGISADSADGRRSALLMLSARH